VLYCPLANICGVSNKYAEIGCVMHIILMGLGEIQGTSVKAILLLMLKIYVTKTSATYYESEPFLSLLVCSCCQPCSSLKALQAARPRAYGKLRVRGTYLLLAVVIVCVVLYSPN